MEDCLWRLRVCFGLAQSGVTFVCNALTARPSAKLFLGAQRASSHVTLAFMSDAAFLWRRHALQSA